MGKQLKNKHSPSELFIIEDDLENFRDLSLEGEGFSDDFMEGFMAELVTYLKNQDAFEEFLKARRNNTANPVED